MTFLPEPGCARAPILWLLVLSFLGGTLAPGAIAAQEEHTLIYGLVPDFPPTTFVDQNGKPSGFYIEVFSRIMDELGYSYRYEVASFNQLYPRILSGQISLFSTLIRNPQRERHFYWPQVPTATGWSTVFVRRGLVINAINDLEHQKIGMIRSDANGQHFREFMSTLNLDFTPVEFADFDELVEAVQTARVLGGVATNTITFGHPGIQSTPIVFNPYPAYTTTSIQSPQWVKDDLDAIHRRLIDLKDDPESWYYELQRKWLLSPSVEVRVIPDWIIAGLAMAILGIMICVVLVRILTRKLRQANLNLEAQVQRRTIELQEANRQLLRVERKNITNRLVNGIAHEVNTPLGITITSLTFLEERLKQLREGYHQGTLTRREMDGMLDTLQESLGISLRNLDRASNLIRTFKSMSVDEQSHQRVPVNLREYLNGIILGLEYLFRGRKVQLEVQAQDRVVAMSLEFFNTIVVNLVMNALEHGFPVETPGARVQVKASVQEGLCTMEVRDNGRGIPPELEEKIFDHFFTTARSEGKLGLGLSIVRHTVVDQLQGSIEVDGSQGAAFVVRFPV